MTQILFLDTETTSLSPSTGEIIEIAGVIMDFDKVSLKMKMISEFSQVIDPKKIIEKKITRLTNITQEELEQSPTRLTVQNEWLEWLEKFDNIALVVGHSIDFDLGFLKFERWYLPENIKAVDTLDLAKIFLSTQNAINLEFLISSLKLEKYVNQMYNSYSSDQKAHRALYDTQYCAGLFYYIIQLIITIKPSKEFVKLLQEKIIHLEFDVYEPKKLSQLVPKSVKNTTLEISLVTQKPKLSSEHKIHFFLETLTPERENELLFILKNSSKDLFKVAASLYISKIWLQNKYSGNLKIHTYTNIEKTFYQELLKYFSPEDDSVYSYTLEPLENIIQRIDKITSQSLNISNLISQLEILVEQTGEPSLKSICTKLSSSLIFLQSSVESKMDNFNKFSYNGLETTPENISVQQKLQEVIKNHNNLKELYVEDLSNFSNYLFAKIKENKIALNVINKYNFSLYMGVFNLSQDNNITAGDHLDLILKKYPDIKLQTYLKPDLWEKLLDLAKLKLSKKPIYLNASESYQGDFKYEDDLKSFLTEKINNGNKNTGINLVLANKNLHVAELSKKLTADFKSQDYLILGESGSLQKIISKSSEDFSGVVVIKSREIEYFLQWQKSNVLTITSLNKPFIYISPYWNNYLNKESQKQLLEIYQQSYFSRISRVSGLKIDILMNYSK